MRREHRTGLQSLPTGSARSARSAFLLALFLVLLLALLVVPAAVPSGTASAAVVSGAADGDGWFRKATARAVRAHERARARVDRLREADARPPKIEAAEERRMAIRAGLWDLLWAVERNVGDPVAVDPSGRAGHCPVPTRSHAQQHQRHQRSPKKKTRTMQRTKPRTLKTPQDLKKPQTVQVPQATQVPKTPQTPHRPWTAPTRGYWLSAGFAAQGSRWAHRHTGQDFAVGAGTPVYAVGPGTVRATTCGDGFGNQVVVRHPDGYFTQYAHLSHIDVRKGGHVSAGQRIGLSGATGNVTGPHLHFEVRITPYMGSAVPPLPWLRRKDVQVIH
ncbi:peptidoglycan DD-metalloendopeptidase family protein [Streptomyces sp. NBC_01275]|uniref:M23 family metallopeptidase n=1 Tax=Streptomyces sp. NBC_01275 TaxID=2903807 RepID=UPI00225A31AF|nr:peptidoglycan DD-metalloendopeptidase family protein [Streptomyces sp. NBC_01275]MCX4763574.1 peptidoglycan DD-metalloendopeptidase family protein [Streptomyces sp. NBC_01275]